MCPSPLQGVVPECILYGEDGHVQRLDRVPWGVDATHRTLVLAAIADTAGDSGRYQRLMRACGDPSNKWPAIEMMYHAPYNTKVVALRDRVFLRPNAAALGACGLNVKGPVLVIPINVVPIDARDPSYADAPGAPDAPDAPGVDWAARRGSSACAARLSVSL